MSLVACSLLLGLAAAPPDWGARASISGDMSAGTLAETAGPAAGAQTEWVPGVDVDMALRRHHLVAGYHPRLGWRVPLVRNGAPVVLHRLSLRYDATPWRRLRLAASSYLDAGDVFYGRSLFVFDGSTLSSNVPSVEVLSFFSAGADASLRWQLDRRQSLALSTALAHNRPLGDTQVSAAFPEQWRSTTSLRYDLVASRRHDLQLELQGRWSQFRPGPSYLALRPSATWRLRFTTHWSAQLLGGAVLAQQQGDSNAVNLLRTPVIPVAELGVEGRQRLVGGLPTRLSLRVGLDGYYDPVTAALTPQASARSQVEVALGPRALASAQLYVYSPLGSGGPAGTGWGWREPHLAGGDVRVAPWASRDLRLDLGIRGFGQWSSTPGLSLQRQELVGFVGLQAGLDASG